MDRSHSSHKNKETRTRERLEIREVRWDWDETTDMCLEPTEGLVISLPKKLPYIPKLKDGVSSNLKD